MKRKPAILAVDDTPANLLALEAVLERDFEVRSVTSGEAAIAMLNARPDVTVILMDVQMPEMDGFQAAARIKRIPGCEDIPIVFVTAVFREDPHVKRGYEAGGVDYFTKPFDPELLRLKVSIYASFREKAAVLKSREEQIRETERVVQAGRKLSTLLESLPVGILIADTQGRICQANDEVARIFKATEAIEHDAYGELLGWWSSSEQAIKGPRGPLARTLETGAASHDTELQIRCFDGSSRQILASVSPLFGQGQKIVGAVVVIRDLTDPKKVGAEFDTRVARLVSLGIELERDARSEPAS
jgi:CheY-like chemotaxis protein